MTDLFSADHLKSKMIGVSLALRLIRTDDAEYVYGLRVNPKYNQHLSKVSGTVQDQIAWIENYKAREAEGLEYYYIIERLDGVRCGTVRLYDIASGAFTWGSWILDHNKTAKAALECAYIIYKIAFDELKLSEANFEVSVDNQNTIMFHNRFGAIETNRDSENLFFTYTRDRFEADREAFRNILEQAASQ